MKTINPLITETEVARRLSVAPYTVRSWRTRKDRKQNIPYVKIGGNVRFDWDKVQAWIRRENP